MADSITVLTICQPYAHLIITPQAELPAGTVRKRVENRRWGTGYRGLLAIHAGRSKDWLELDTQATEPTDLYGIRVADMAFGAIVGFVDLVGCVRLQSRVGGGWEAAPGVVERYPWLLDHIHAEGPFCWILGNARRLQTPVPARGQRQLWQWQPPVAFEELELTND